VELRLSEKDTGGTCSNINKSSIFIAESRERRN
jgi:hypothetical protein